MVKKILVVDNHPVMLKFMAQFLEKEGYQVRVAESGLSALDLLKTETPDVIFTDLVMPHIGGEKLCQIIRNTPRLKNVYVVIVTAVAAEEETRFADFGADACIAKGPIDKMGHHVLSVLRQLEQKAPFASPLCVGLEDVYPRQITKELLSVKRHYEVVLKEMTEGILEMTPYGRILYANPRALCLLGLPENELLASDFTHLVEESDRQKVEDLLKALDVGTLDTARESGVAIQGKEISLIFLPVVTEGRKTVILICDDVSERKRMEAQLLQAQKREAIGTLAGGIAHDFNNLLMVIQGNVSLMLLDLDASHPHYEMLKGIEKKVQAGSKLTSQLLGYARKGMYEIKALQLNALVEETAEAFGRTRKEIVIHRNLAPTLSLIEADPGQIEQVLMNLLINAADAMPGGGDLFLGTANVDAEKIQAEGADLKSGHYVLLTVRDTGTGMGPKVMERIFDPFFTTKGLGRGTGLGLASAYGIVKGHKGHIDVESEEGKGTLFKVYLPVVERKGCESVPLTRDVRPGAGGVLIVDDEEMVLDVGRRFLGVLGYQVLAAGNGREAIALYESHRELIDLVILDLVMPGLGGDKVFNRLREINPDVKVLLASGYSIDGEAARLLERGCAGFIQKPYTLEHLSQSLKSIVERKEIVPPS